MSTNPPKHTYETVEGTEPDVDEQHEPRTLKHFVDGSLEHMMSELGDGTFVAWSQCQQCRKHARDCACPGGPVEAEYVQRWRDDRFTHSFGRRHALPSLPEATKTLNRRIDSVLRLLQSQGWTITPPATKVALPADYDWSGEREMLENDQSLVEAIGDESDAIAEPTTDRLSRLQEGTYDVGF